MTCREFVEFMMEYTAGELAAEVRVPFDDHLARCSNCRRYLTSYEETVKLGKRAFDDESADLPSDVPEELVRAILGARRR